jgi:choline-sulfatase
MRRPNLLVFMTDQQRGDVVLPGHPCRTPMLDTFRAEGVTFSRAYCPAPHCCPSRASFFSGLYPSEHGVWNNVAVQNALSTGLRPGTRLFSQDLVERGYACDFVGKWHVSFDEAPRDYGFREHLVGALPAKDGAGTMGHTWADYAQMAKASARGARRPFEIIRPGWGDCTLAGIHEDPFGDRAVTQRACELLEDKRKAARDEPWFIYCGTLGPHDPYCVPQRFLELYRDVPVELPPSFDDRMTDKPALYRRTRSRFDQLTPDEHREAIRHYWAFCSYEDWLFGQLLQALEASGQAEDTLVLYCSDHGDYAGEHGLWCKGLPCFRGAYHVPMIARWPAFVQKPGRIVESFASLTDVAPTVREIVGTAHGAKTSGRSLLPWLRGEEPAQWRSALYTQTNGNEQYGIQRSVMTERYKYVHNGFDFDELYDLEQDPHELTNLATDPAYEPVVRDLCGRMWAFARERDDACINSYIMVGMAPYGPAEGARVGVCADG